MIALPAYPRPISISQARADLPPEQFRQRLRSHLLSHPGLTLAQVAKQLNLKRQRVAQIVGRLNRPDCTSPLFMRLAPKTEEARQKIPELTRLVSQGLSAERAAAQIQISLPMAIKLGFRSRPLKHPHGTPARAEHCRCWRCCRLTHQALPRGRHADANTRAQVLDWAAWTEPFTGEPLSQALIGKLSGISQGAVSRITRMGQ